MPGTVLLISLARMVKNPVQIQDSSGNLSFISSQYNLSLSRFTPHFGCFTHISLTVLYRLSYFCIIN